MSDGLSATPASSWTFAGLFPSWKKRQPAFSSSLLIFSLAVASFLLYLTQGYADLCEALSRSTSCNLHTLDSLRRRLWLVALDPYPVFTLARLRQVVGSRAREIGRSLAVGPHDAVLRRHRAWMATSAAKEAYRLRKQLVEPVFGIIKEQQMARRFLLLGLVNVAAEWTMLATAFNLRTLWRAWRSRAFIQLPHWPNLHPAS